MCEMLHAENVVDNIPRRNPSNSVQIHIFIVVVSGQMRTCIGNVGVNYWTKLQSLVPQSESPLFSLVAFLSFRHPDRLSNLFLMLISFIFVPCLLVFPICLDKMWSQIIIGSQYSWFHMSFLPSFCLNKECWPSFWVWGWGQILILRQGDWRCVCSCCGLPADTACFWVGSGNLISILCCDVKKVSVI